MVLADVLEEFDARVAHAGDDANFYDEDRQTGNARWLMGRVLSIDEGAGGQQILRTPPPELREALKRAETTGWLTPRVYFRARAEFYTLQRTAGDPRWQYHPRWQ